jgi:hypothetical protein
VEDGDVDLGSFITNSSGELCCVIVFSLTFSGGAAEERGGLHGGNSGNLGEMISTANDGVDTIWEFNGLIKEPGLMGKKG